MKVGKKVAVMSSPAGHMIYATNMMPKQLPPTATPEEIEKAKQEYEVERKKQADANGELD